MPIDFPTTLKLLSSGAPNATGAYIAMGLNALVFLDLEKYDTKLGDALGVDVVSRYGGGTPFVPHVLQLSGEGGAIFAFEGTRTYQQWISFVVGAGVVEWEGGHGDVFAPFADITKPIRSAVGGAAQAAGTAYLTGHSLGAACAALMIPLVVDSDTKVGASYLFACPRSVGNRFINRMGQTPFLVNHPFDPVPVITPDCVTDLRRDPLSMQFRGPIQCPGQPFWLARHAQLVRGLTALDYLTGIAAGFGGGESSIHNTFRYIRDTFSEVPDELGPPLQEYTDLLQDLGLFDPWPG